MAKKNDEGGVWRTISGRKVYIKEGQSIQDAMKESGKFENSKTDTKQSKLKGTNVEDFLKKNSLTDDDDFDSIDEKMEKIAEKMDEMSEEGTDDDPAFELLEQEYDKLLEKQNEFAGELTEDLYGNDYDSIDAEMEKLAEQMDKMTDEGKDEGPEFEKLANRYDELMDKRDQIESGMVEDLYSEDDDGGVLKETALQAYENGDISYEELRDEYFDGDGEDVGKALDQFGSERAKKELSDPDTWKDEYGYTNEEREVNETIGGRGFEMEDGSYLNVEYKDGKLYAGSVTNAGMTHDYEIDYDKDESLDANLETLYDQIQESNRVGKENLVSANTSIEQAEKEYKDALAQYEAFEEQVGPDDPQYLQDQLNEYGRQADEAEARLDQLRKKANTIKTGDKPQNGDYSVKHSIENPTDEQLNEIWENEDATEVYDYLTESENRKLQEAYRDAELGNESAQQYIDKMEKEAAKRYIENNVHTADFREKYGYGVNPSDESLYVAGSNKTSNNIDKEFPSNFSEEVEDTAHGINARGYDDIDDVVDDFAKDQGISREEARYALLKDEFKTRQDLYERARQDGSYSQQQLEDMEGMAKDSYFKLQEAQQEYQKAKQDWHQDKISREEFDKIRDRLDRDYYSKKNKDDMTINELNDEMLGNRFKGKGETPSLVYSNGRRIDIANNDDGGKTATVWKDGKIERKTRLPENVKGDKTKDYFDTYLKQLDDTSNAKSNDDKYKEFSQSEDHINTIAPYDDTDYSYAYKGSDGKWIVKNPIKGEYNYQAFDSKEEAMEEMADINKHIRSGNRTSSYEGITKYDSTNDIRRSDSGYAKDKNIRKTEMANDLQWMEEHNPKYKSSDDYKSLKQDYEDQFGEYKSKGMNDKIREKASSKSQNLDYDDIYQNKMSKADKKKINDLNNDYAQMQGAEEARQKVREEQEKIYQKYANTENKSTNETMNDAIREKASNKLNTKEDARRQAAKELGYKRHTSDEQQVKEIYERTEQIMKNNPQIKEYEDFRDNAYRQAAKELGYKRHTSDPKQNEEIYNRAQEIINEKYEKDGTLKTSMNDKIRKGAKKKK